VAGRAGVSTPLVAIHGFSDSGACMRALLDRLGLPDATAPNLLAHGGRAMPSGIAFSHDNLVDDMLVTVSRAVEAAGRPVALYGHSLGASTAAGVAARAPDLVRTLVLEDPPWQVPTSPDADSEDDLDTDRANGHRPWLEGLQGTDHAGRLGWLRENNPGWPAAEHSPWAQAKAQVDLALFDAPQQWLRRSWGRVARGVGCPTLLMVGEPELGAASEPGVADMLEVLPGWTVRRISGAGHNLRRERPDVVADLVQVALAEAGWRLAR
jgi:pimeloyl-ACP methyl ester carboxylesterase